MKIILNNKEEYLDTKLEKLSIAQLLELKKFSFPRLIVKVNDRIIKKEEYESTFFIAGDKVDVIHMISGG